MKGKTGIGWRSQAINFERSQLPINGIIIFEMLSDWCEATSCPWTIHIYYQPIAYILWRQLHGFALKASHPGKRIDFLATISIVRTLIHQIMFEYVVIIFHVEYILYIWVYSLDFEIISGTVEHCLSWNGDLMSLHLMQALKAYMDGHQHTSHSILSGRCSLPVKFGSNFDRSF